MKEPKASKTDSSKSPDIGDSIPDSVPGYRLLRRLGGGAQSAVYRAEQRDPRRSAAIKLVRGGNIADEIDTQVVQGKLKAVAGLRHPGIASIYEIGHIDAACLFIAMEYVRGMPIDEYVRLHKLKLRERIRLVVRVGEAVCHAHRRGVFHRELRPDNILVNADGHPKVIDYGMSVVSDHDGRTIGPFSSPEEAGGALHTEDAVADVYSLGAILYLLLTGQPVFSSEDRGAFDLVQAVCKEIPTGPRVVAPQLDADVEAIILRAIEKDPSHRYQSMEAFLSDLSAYLEDRPIAARRSDRLHNYRLLVRRNKAVFAVLVIGGLFSSVMSAMATMDSERRLHDASVHVARKAIESTTDQVRISELSDRLVSAKESIKRLTEERDEVVGSQEELLSKQREELDAAAGAQEELRRIADQHLREAREAERRADVEARRAETTSETADAFSRTLLGIFRIFSTAQENGSGVTLEGLLDHCLGTISDQLVNQPVVQAALVDTIGMVYQGLGRSDRAVPLVEWALSTRRESLGEADPETIRSLNNLALLHFARNENAEAEALSRDLLMIVRQALGEEHPRTLTVMNNLALLLHARGERSESEAFFRQSLDGRRRILGSDHPKTLATMYNLATLLEAGGEFEEAERFFADVRETGRGVLPEGHWLVFSAANGLGACLAARGRFEEAEPLLIDSHEALVEIFGANHDLSIRSRRRVERFYDLWAEPDEASEHEEIPWIKHAAEPLP